MLVERVKALPFEREEIPFLTKVAEEIEKSNLDFPVLYAGSGGDLEHGVVLGNRLIFVDSHLPETNLAEIRRKAETFGEVIKEKRVGKLGNGGKHVIRFEFLGEVIELIYYAEDATELLKNPPKEIKDGLSVYFVKVPLPKEPKVGSLRSPDSLAKALKLVVIDGFYLERECPLCRVLKPELLGFEKIASGYISALSVYNEKGNLYRKVKDVDNIEELLKIDLSLSGGECMLEPL
ncbi:hypothetical protein [Archaeoglobus sp.]